MKVPIILALAAGEYMDSATLIQWLKEPGTEVKEGDPLVVVETAKASLEIPAPASGVLVQTIFKANDEISIGETIGWIETEKGDAPAPVSSTPEKRKRKVKEKVLDTSIPDSTVQQSSPERRQRILASPMARNMAAELGIDLNQVTGSGPGGRIVKRDIAKAAETIQVAEYEAAPQTGYRPTTARRMAESAAIPQFELTAQVEMTEFLSMRETLSDDNKLSVTALLTRAVAEALKQHPRLNSLYVDHEVRQYRAINLGVAVATEAGLAVPVIPQADQLSPLEIDHQLRQKQERARQQQLTLEDVRNGTFTISNLGSKGIIQFRALINPPQAAILAVGAIHSAWVSGAVQPRMAPCCLMTLTCDHRALDGADGAAFLETLKIVIEDMAWLSGK